MQLYALFAFGILVGCLSGLLGIGGGVVLVPGLIFLFGLSQAEAQGTSLTVLSLPIVAAAAFVYYQNGHVRLPVAGVIAAGFLIGAFSGAKLVPHLPLPALRVALGALLIYIGFFAVMSPYAQQTKAALPAFVSWLIAWLLGRRKKPPVLPDPAPAEHPTEYHI